MAVSSKDIIKWQLRYLKDVASELCESELNLLISFEEQFIRKDSLSEAQMEVLNSIYKRH